MNRPSKQKPGRPAGKRKPVGFITCDRVGGIRGMLPRTETGDCIRCKGPVWVSGRVIDDASLARMKLLYICHNCNEASCFDSDGLRRDLIEAGATPTVVHGKTTGWWWRHA
jgi:hypothetical protein